MIPPRIVLKFGSGILARSNGQGLDPSQLKRLGEDVAKIVRKGFACIVVTSGAVAAGMAVLGLSERPTELPELQACAAIGQSKLMQSYEASFARHEISVAQLLVTHSDLDSKARSQNIRATLDRLLANHVVPIINENDSVGVEELRFGDNDHLSAELARLAHADLLILLTSVDGLLDKRGNVVPEVTDVAAVVRLATRERGKYSVGGMVSKLEAVKLTVDHGITTVIASGRKPGQIAAIVAGKPAGTRFVAVKKDRV